MSHIINVRVCMCVGRDGEREREREIERERAREREQESKRDRDRDRETEKERERSGGWERQLDSRVVFLRDNVKREASCMYYGCVCALVRVDVRRVCGA